MVSFFTYLRQKLAALVMRFVLSFRLGPIRAEIAKVPTLFPGIKKESISIPSRDPGCSINATLYHPPSVASDGTPAQSGPKPVLVNWHGSGFVLTGLHGSDTYFCAKIAQDAGCYVIDADYRKSPENRWPAAVHDAEDAVNWVATQPDRFDVKSVAVSGSSAGGNLALVAAGPLRRDLKVDVKAVAAVYPVVDLSIPSDQKVVPKPIRALTPKIMDFFNACYLPDASKKTDPLVSPALASITEFPPTVVIITAAGDVLAPEADALAKRLDDGQRLVVHKNYPDMWHGFDMGSKEGTPEWQIREEAYGKIVEALRKSLFK
ncbi:alpha/beta-hydrolase [Pyrenochaeta sp. DS3sAY3a]|nr:alpha/beta-hydrolase [Pyrenochaeta sp. DS3sAY3a]